MTGETAHLKSARDVEPRGYEFRARVRVMEPSVASPFPREIILMCIAPSAEMAVAMFAAWEKQRSAAELLDVVSGPHIVYQKVVTL